MTQSTQTVYLNGEFLPLDQAKIPVLDRGFLFGDGVYEVIPVYGGQPLRLKEHLRRLERSLSAILIESPLSDENWTQIIHRLIDGADDYSVGLAKLVNYTLGSRVVGKDTTPQGTTDFASTIAKIKKSKANAVIYTGYFAEAATLVKQLRDSGSKATFAAGDAAVVRRWRPHVVKRTLAVFRRDRRYRAARHLATTWHDAKTTGPRL